eukprot:scaffold5317_cov160-Amphora_coffeaeformis.AAC.17
MHTPALSTRRLILTSFASAVVWYSSGRSSSTVTGFQSILGTTTRIAFKPTALKMAPSDGSGSKSLYLFDFDGVVCDSCDECTVSALRTCQRLGVFRHDDDNERKLSDLAYPPAWLFEKMREIRPAIEVGWQIPVMLSVFLEQQKDPSTAMSVDEMIQNYETLVEDWLIKNAKATSDEDTTPPESHNDSMLSVSEKSRQRVIDMFGTVRDDWIQDDLSSWLDVNRFYPGVPEAINSCKGSTVLVTTKQQRFAIALCRHAGVNATALPDDMIYGLGQYKKKGDVISDQMTAGNYDPTNTHFFEDRWPTLAKCLKDPRLDGVNLYLCSWGYVAKTELELAQAEPRVNVISLEDFSKVASSS